MGRGSVWVGTRKFSGMYYAHRVVAWSPTMPLGLTEGLHRHEDLRSARSEDSSSRLNWIGKAAALSLALSLNPGAP